MSRLGAIFEAGDEPVINEVVVAEVRAGLTFDEEAEFARLLVPIAFVQPGPTSSMLAGRWRREARERGTTSSLPDVRIAAAAEAAGAAVLTRNVRGFELTPVAVIIH